MQVPGHVAAHTVISPVLSQNALSPETSMSTPPSAGGKTRDRWPLPPLPQRTPPHGRKNGAERLASARSDGGGEDDESRGDGSIMPTRAESRVSDIPARVNIPGVCIGFSLRIFFVVVFVYIIMGVLARTNLA